jgi:hypothetical protein
LTLKSIVQVAYNIAFWIDDISGVGIYTEVLSTFRSLTLASLLYAMKFAAPFSSPNTITAPPFRATLITRPISWREAGIHLIAEPIKPTANRVAKTTAYKSTKSISAGYFSRIQKDIPSKGSNVSSSSTYPRQTRPGVGTKGRSTGTVELCIVEAQGVCISNRVTTHIGIGIDAPAQPNRVTLAESAEGCIEVAEVVVDASLLTKSRLISEPRTI